MQAKNSLMVTTSWDDGTTTDLKLAELLHKYGIKGTFYISKIPSANLLSEPQIKELDKHIELGAHTLNHPDLTMVPVSEAKMEIENSKSYLEDLLGHSIAMFCYPYGKYNENIVEIVKNTGFMAARTTDAGGLELPENPYAWHITLTASNSSPLMALKIWWRFKLWKPGSLLDWESRAKSLFDLALERGGVYHLYGHSVEHESHADWDKLERVLAYISKRGKVQYLTNGEVFGHRPR
jgi:peptidoglycan/xylan/chitin deacetylase (PgdA/CDA1 family)